MEIWNFADLIHQKSFERMFCMLILFIAMSFKCAVGIEIGDGGTSNKSEIQTSKNKIDHSNSGKKIEYTSDMENLQNNRMSIDRPHLR